VIKGLSVRDYATATEDLIDSIGLSKSSVSEQAKKRMGQNLAEFESRDLSGYDITALLLDGKYLRKHQVVIAMGITMQGDKIVLGFVQASSENATLVRSFLASLGQRGLKHDQGLLVVLDVAKGLEKGVREYFGDKAIIQRCRWHKRENVLSYLPEDEKERIKNQFDNAVYQDGYNQAKASLEALVGILQPINRSAAKSLEEGMEEILTLQKLGMNSKFKRQLVTTNAIESLNSQIGKYLRKVKRWQNSDMIYRWMATALLESEQKFRKVGKAKHLPQLRKAIQATLNFN
jgi:transposase-like protein